MQLLHIRPADSKLTETDIIIDNYFAGKMIILSRCGVSIT